MSPLAQSAFEAVVYTFFFSLHVFVFPLYCDVSEEYYLEKIKPFLSHFIVRKFMKHLKLLYFFTIFHLMPREVFNLFKNVKIKYNDNE